MTIFFPGFLSYFVSILAKSSIISFQYNSESVCFFYSNPVVTLLSVCLFTAAAWHIKPGIKTTISSTAVTDKCVMSVLVSTNSFWYSEHCYIMYNIECGFILYIDCITLLGKRCGMWSSKTAHN
jgi:succinate dehydrogenase hydrophobic anchor subunit